MSDEVVVNGIHVGPSTDLPSLLRRQLIDGSILAARYDDSPEPGIWSLFAAAKGTTLEQRLIQAVESLLTDSDPRVRSGAVGLAQAYAEKFRASDLLRVLTAHRNLFEGITMKTGEPDLAWGLLRAMAGSSNWSPQVTERLRSAALEFPNGSSVLAGLVSHDPDWAIQHAQEIVGDQPARANILLYRLKDPGQRERLIKSIPVESPQLRKVFADAVSGEIKDPVEKQRLLSLLR
jgi:hypothetical protein